ncbi:MAG: glycoside hydrolase family 127 protein [bacterium]|nr:glycoside hydrolase family 127 protein [bacterium]
MMIVTLGMLATISAGADTATTTGDYPLTPVPFTQVRIEDAFWRPRMDVNKNVTISYCFQKSEETGRISNFAKAGGLEEGAFEGIFFNDSDVFKIIEGAAYALALEPDPELDAYLDDLIAKIAAAQEDDGYLYTCRTIDPDNVQKGCGPERWSNLRSCHELYNVGHMYEAATAHYIATGKRSLLDVAIKNADLIDSVFGPDGLHDVPGHEEIEIGLARLSRVANEPRYLALSKFFLDERGRSDHREIYGDYCQDHVPVVDQHEAVGHAVRAGYLYSGMADVAAMTGDTAYTNAIDRIWEDVVSAKLALTGGIGARRHGEAFGPAYELPNAEAYNETCAAIANAMWNHRMFLFHGDARYIDVLERILYNGALAGVSMEGNTFFYPNPLSSDGVTPFNQGTPERAPWFGCSCCPVNVARFMPSIANYVYAAEPGRDSEPDAVYVNLFVGGSGSAHLPSGAVTVTQETEYPWDGAIRISVDSDKPRDLSLRVRVPGWAVGVPVPVVDGRDPLYRYEDQATEPVQLLLNGEPLPLNVTKGYADIRREWRKTDVLEMRLPMPIRRAIANEQVESTRGRVALERGPLIYCAEAVDNDAMVRNLALPAGTELTAAREPDLLGGVVVLRGTAAAKKRNDDESVSVGEQPFMAVPYYAWCHRGANEMAVWLHVDPDNAEVAPVPTLASKSRATASHSHDGDTITALNDGLDPADSNDHRVPRHTWWSHKGTEEWVQYDFAESATVSAVEVYWFDDTGQGACRVPASWKLLYRSGDKWKPVKDSSKFGTKRNRFNRTTFKPVKTEGLRIEVKLQEEVSGGILEWRVEEN